MAPETGSRVENITDAALQKLMDYHWPGNVRELQNVIERGLVLCSRTSLGPEDIRLETARRNSKADSPRSFLPDGMTLDQYEQELIREALKRVNGNKSQAARLLGLTRNALRYRLTQMGLEA
jgi:DNA-binding NtrC family response regulator